jgi:hypothetical protein
MAGSVEIWQESFSNRQKDGEGNPVATKAGWRKNGNKHPGGRAKRGRNAPEPVEGKAVSSTQGKETTRGADRKSGKKQPRGLMEKQKEKAIMR